MSKPMMAAVAAAIAVAPLSVLAAGSAHAYTGYCSATGGNAEGGINH